MRTYKDVENALKRAERKDLSTCCGSMVLWNELGNTPKCLACGQICGVVKEREDEHSR